MNMISSTREAVEELKRGHRVALSNRQVDRCPGTEGLDLARTHLSHVVLQLVLVSVVPRAVQVEERASGSALRYSWPEDHEW